LVRNEIAEPRLQISSKDVVLLIDGSEMLNSTSKTTNYLDLRASRVKLRVPPDVLRLTQIFDKLEPQFFVDGADTIDIIQGRLGDYWFLSALSTLRV